MIFEIRMIRLSPYTKATFRDHNSLLFLSNNQEHIVYQLSETQPLELFRVFRVHSFA